MKIVPRLLQPLFPCTNIPIPNDVIAFILSFFPFKQRMRFALVSKTWWHFLFVRYPSCWTKDAYYITTIHLQNGKKISKTFFKCLEKDLNDDHKDLVILNSLISFDKIDVKFYGQVVGAENEFWSQLSEQGHPKNWTLIEKAITEQSKTAIENGTKVVLASIPFEYDKTEKEYFHGNEFFSGQLQDRPAKWELMDRLAYFVDQQKEYQMLKGFMIGLSKLLSIYPSKKLINLVKTALQDKDRTISSILAQSRLYIYFEHLPWCALLFYYIFEPTPSVPESLLKSLKGFVYSGMFPFEVLEPVKNKDLKIQVLIYQHDLPDLNYNNPDLREMVEKHRLYERVAQTANLENVNIDWLQFMKPITIAKNTRTTAKFRAKMIRSHGAFWDKSLKQEFEKALESQPEQFEMDFHKAWTMPPELQIEEDPLGEDFPFRDNDEEESLFGDSNIEEGEPEDSNDLD